MHGADRSATLAAALRNRYYSRLIVGAKWHAAAAKCKAVVSSGDYRHDASSEHDAWELRINERYARSIDSLSYIFFLFFFSYGIAQFCIQPIRAIKEIVAGK